MAALAALAAVLAIIGIAGVVAHFLSEQTRDIGIRMALGAGAKREVARVVQHALQPTALGLAVGLVLTLASSSVLESFLFGVEPTDPMTYATVTVALLVVAAVAAWIPAPVRRPWTRLASSTGTHDSPRSAVDADRDSAFRHRPPPRQTAPLHSMLS